MAPRRRAAGRRARDLPPDSNVDGRRAGHAPGNRGDDRGAHGRNDRRAGPGANPHDRLTPAPSATIRGEQEEGSMPARYPSTVMVSVVCPWDDREQLDE